MTLDVVMALSHIVEKVGVSTGMPTGSDRTRLLTHITYCFFDPDPQNAAIYLMQRVMLLTRKEPRLIPHFFFNGISEMFQEKSFH